METPPAFTFIQEKDHILKRRNFFDDNDTRGLE